MKKLFIILITLTFTSCAYFNIYYNAERSYKEAVSSKKENNRNNAYLSKADSTISKASKLIQYYPKSSLVDDALLLIAKAYILKGGKENYSKALTKLDEIEQYYRNNDNKDEIDYLYAYILFMNGSYNDALTKLSRIKNIYKNEDALILKAKCLVEMNKDSDAIKLLKSSFKKKISKDKAIALYDFLGDLYTKNGNYDKSGVYYNKILKLNPNKEMQYTILLKLSSIKIQQGHFDDALISLKKLLNRAPDQDKYNTVNLSIANIYEKQNNYDKASKIYNDIINSSHNDSITIRAINHASLIEENINNDMERATKILKKIDKIRLRDSIYYECKNRFKSLNEIINLTKIDSLKADSISTDSITKNKLRIAELYAFNLNHPDKAKSIFLSLYDAHKEKRYNDKILYSIGWIYRNIYANSDSADYYEKLLLDRYPESFYARVIKGEKSKITNNKQ